MWLDIFPDGKVYEMEGSNAIGFFDTDNEVKKLVTFLSTTPAGKFAIAPANKPHPVLAPQSPSIPQAAIDLIKEFEGYGRQLNDGTDRVKAYPDPAYGWSVPTIGYGTTRYPDGRKIAEGDIISRQDAEQYLMWEVQEKCRTALNAIPTWKQMNDNQRSALYSFAYNLGADFYSGPSFNSITNVCDSPSRWGDDAWIAEQFGKYVRSNGQVLIGLARRRRAEAQLFCKR